VVRQAAHPTLVLGSTQRVEIVRPQRAADASVEVVRRRGGGGAVLLRPGDHLWVEAWIPRDDPLWEADVSVATAWVGEWWRAALDPEGAGDMVVHRGPAAPGSYGALVCFSGRGPGEVFQRDRKVMGISQWRSREGSLFHTCAYVRWDPAALLDLLEVNGTPRAALERELARAAVGVDDLKPAGPALTVVRDTLLSSFPTWGEDRPTHSR
jgi:lipoate-protein ligase A